MSDSLPTVLTDSPLAIPAEFLASLTTPQDYENAFSMVTQEKNKYIWWEADLIYNYYRKFLGQHLDVYRAGQLMNSSTVKYYLRTASGFPPEFRIPSISFNHHYQASFADEWDSKTLAFQGERRFVYSAQAADDQLSTRQLKDTIEIDQEKEARKLEEIPCDHPCSKTGKTWPYIFMKSGPKTVNTLPQRLWLHDACYEEIIRHIYN